MPKTTDVISNKITLTGPTWPTRRTETIGTRKKNGMQEGQRERSEEAMKMKRRYKMRFFNHQISFPFIQFYLSEASD